MKEEFRPIKDFERYYVSNLGRVLNIRTGRFLTMTDNHGYLVVNISKNGKARNFLVHRLVSQAFIENPNNYDTVDHINGIKTDNRAENLQWLSQSDNTKRFWKEQASKEWKEQKTRAIICIETEKIYGSIAQASKELNISHGCISDNLNGRLKQTHGLHFEYLLKE